MEPRRRWWTLVAVTLATFMPYLDNNIVNVALPTIQHDLGLTTAGLEWVVSGYILVFASLMLAGGRLADVYGRRRLFLAGIAIFTLASLLAGLSTDGTILVLGRSLQGVGAAMLVPVGLAMLPAAFPDQRERNLAVGVWSAVGALSLAIGPLAGGFISQHWHWSWIFLINVPIGVLTCAISVAAIRESRVTRIRRRLELPGLTLSAVALFAITYVLIEGASQGWTSPVILGLFATAVLAGAAFVVVEAHSTDPMIDVSLLRDRVFVGGTLALGLWAFGVFGIYFYTALYLQNVLGFSPVEAGLTFVPMAVATAAFATVSGAIARRLGTDRTVAGALALMAVALLGVASVGGDGSRADLMPWIVAYGVGAGLIVPLTATVLNLLPAERESVASGVLNVSREVFGLLGVTVLGAILGAHQTAQLARGALPPQAFLSGYQLALVIAAAILAVGIPVSLRALRTTHLPAAGFEIERRERFTARQPTSGATP